jgi:hypothetical protein
MSGEDILRRGREVEIRHPNREKPESNTARLGTFALLILSGLMMLVIAIGGWGTMTSGKPSLVLIMILYFVFAYLVWIWNRGVLPVSAGAATVVLIFALIAGPGWFQRGGEGFEAATIPESVLGMLTLGLIPVQMLLIVISVWAFTQEWNVEEEVTVSRPHDQGPREHGPPDPGQGPPPSEPAAFAS